MTPTAGSSHVAPLGMLEGQPSSPGRGRGAGDSGRCGAILQGALPAAPSVPWIAKQLPRELLAPAAIGLAVGLKGVGGPGVLRWNAPRALLAVSASLDERRARACSRQFSRWSRLRISQVGAPIVSSRSARFKRRFSVPPSVGLTNPEGACWSDEVHLG